MEKLPVTVNLANNPHVKQLLESDPEALKTIIKAFTGIFDTACRERWDLLPGELDATGEMTFEALLHGMLEGSFNAKEFNPTLFEVLGMSIHPLAVLKKQNLMSVNTSDDKMYDWREFYALPRDAKVDKDSIAEIIRNILRYNRWIPTKEFYEALGAGGDAVDLFRQMDENQVAKLAYLPALKYQRRVLGELHVGRFLGNTGAFDAGTIRGNYDDEMFCPACELEHLTPFNEAQKVCLRCQAGFTIQEG